MNVRQRFLLVGKINAEVTRLRSRPRSTRVNGRRCLTDTLKSYLPCYGTFLLPAKVLQLRQKILPYRYPEIAHSQRC